MSRYDKAEKALRDLEKTRAEDPHWNEVLISLAAVDTSCNVGSDDTNVKSLLTPFVYDTFPQTLFFSL